MILHPDVKALMSRLIELLEYSPLEAGVASSRKQKRFIDDVMNGTIDSSVIRINDILRHLRRRFDLQSGDNTVWESYITAALTAIETHLNDRVTLKTPTPLPIDVINNTFQNLNIDNPGTASFHIVQGVDAIVLPNSRLATNAVIQVASQFNFLESKTPKNSKLIEYIHDPTQGPRASLSSLAALYLRNFFFKHRDPNAHFFNDITQDMTKNLPMYEGGYFMPYRMSLRQQSNFTTLLRNNIRNLNILAQWGFPEVGDQRNSILQVFTAAPSYQDEATPLEGSHAAEICTILVEAQYRAISQIAATRSFMKRTRVPLHLTLVGQGAFNNPPSVMRAALNAVYDTVSRFDVDVYIHGYSKTDVELIHRSVPTQMRTDYTFMDKDTFFATAQLPRVNQPDAIAPALPVPPPS
jgi:hypothetical protein